MTARDGRAALLHAAHVVHGGVLLLRPAGGGADGPTRIVVRVLGARHVLQGLAGLGAPRWVTPAVGATVDGVHAASMVGLAALDRGHRRAALASAAVATAFALVARRVARAG